VPNRPTISPTNAAPSLALRREPLAKAMGVNVKVIDELTRENRIPHLRLTDRLVIYPVGAVADWLAAEAGKAVKS
jgi:hypothetical protein